MISAIILAAGLSQRMGQPKMLLRWGARTVLGQVITAFRDGGIADVLVVTGGAHEDVERIVRHHAARSIFNSDFASSEMLSSLQIGLQAQTRRTQAILIGLGDQPQVQAATIRLICQTFRGRESKLIVPSFQRRRGHPWLVERSLWKELMRMQPPQTSRDFLNEHSKEIFYVNVDTPTVLADLDTPEDYQASQP